MNGEFQIGGDGKILVEYRYEDNFFCKDEGVLIVFIIFVFLVLWLDCSLFLVFYVLKYWFLECKYWESIQNLEELWNLVEVFRRYILDLNYFEIFI